MFAKAFFTGLLLAGLGLAQTAPDSGAVDRGLATYGFYCMSCHGADGRGGVDGGSDLTQSAMLAADDGAAQFAAFIPVGRPDQRMPPTPLPEREIADLWAFVQVLVSPGPAAPPDAGAATITGDPDEGEKIFETASCGRCHSVTGDLQKIGGRLDVSAIHQRLLKPVTGGRDVPARSKNRGAEAVRGHTGSVKKLSEQAVRDLAVYLATLR